MDALRARFKELFASGSRYQETGGIHAAEYGHADDPEPEKLAAFLAGHGFEIAAVMSRLR